ncbi:MAG: family 10 glycosylhydrolase [Armatimonadetes bacterium]|nr:family 10 glycosylhydrolase [Armatimonadota bacterium]
MISTIVLGALVAVAAPQGVPGSRFEYASPFPSLPWTKIQSRLARFGVAQEFAAREGVQGRVLWIDGTGNLERCNTGEKVASLMAKIAAVGFNTVVYDVKPIVGRTLYPSKLAPKMTEWKGQSMPADFDALGAMLLEAHKNGLSFFVSLNAFSEGHSYAQRDSGKPGTQFGDPGWGYEHPDLQSVRYSAHPLVAAFTGDMVRLSKERNEWSDGADLAFVTGTSISPTAQLYALLDSSGRVVSLSEEYPSAVGTVLAARGEGIAFLRLYAQPGMSLRLDSVARFLRSGQEQNQIPLMMNPHLDAVRERALSFVEEVLQNYDVDGLLLDDRLRFGGIDSDFSDEARLAFEKYVGREVAWPDDAYKVTYNWNLSTGIEPGPLFDAWLTFRARTMADWVADARKTVDRVRPGTKFGVYAGAWYGAYASYGSNYGSDRLSAGFPFLTRHYRDTGFAGSLDVLITGCYYPVPTTFAAMRRGKPVGRTVEAGGIISNRVARSQCWTYAGIMLSDYRGSTADLQAALQAAAATTQGVMVFDLSHNMDDYWDVFATAFKQPKRAPHEISGLLDAVRKRRALLDASGVQDPPFPFFVGAPLAGF